MDIQVASRYREPISAIIHKESNTWLDFLHIDLLNPQIDGISLLKGEHIFILQLQNSEYVIGKVKKDFEFSTSAFNRRLHFKSVVLSSYTSRQLLGKMTQLGYTSGANLEFVGIAKGTKEQDTTKVTLASDTTKQYLLLHPMLIFGTKVNITSPTNEAVLIALSTLIKARGLPLDVKQVQSVATICRLIGPKNVLNVSFDRA